MYINMHRKESEGDEHVFVVILWDVDGTMLVNQFPNGKKNVDITADKPFAWVMNKAIDADVNIMVSGRGTELKQVTLGWWKSNDPHNLAPMYYVGVDWKHQETHDQRMLDYIDRKRQALKELLVKWGNALSASNIPFEFHVYEDDESVLRGVMSKWDDNTILHFVKDGEILESWDHYRSLTLYEAIKGEKKSTK